MDPLTHAIAGATLGWVVTHRHLGKRALVVGAIAALVPDADVLIRSASDPLLAIEHHRGFTHSLLFTPIGALLVALPFRRQLRWTWLGAMVAWLSHALLDASTTYGTQLFWPFSRHRVGLDLISIIDPIFTILCVVGLIAAWRTRQRFATIALACALLWLVLGLVQRERAEAAQERLAKERGDPRTRGAVFPTIANRVVWRSLYATDDRTLRIDRIRIPWFGAATITPVASVRHITDTRSSHDLARFAWFSDGWMATDPTDATIIGDARYSMFADRYVPVWGIRLEPTEWVNRSRQRRLGQ